MEFKNGDVVSLGSDGKIKPLDPLAHGVHSLGIVEVRTSKFLPEGKAYMISTPPTPNSNWFKGHWIQPKPEPKQTPTQQLCDAACIVNGIEPPSRKSKSLSLSDLDDAFKYLSQSQHKPDQLIMHPDQYAAYLKLTGIK